MPTTLAAALVLLVALVPGMMGDRVYSSIVGLDWRERESRAILRLLGLSVVGAALYSAAAAVSGWPPPVHLIPASYTNLGPDGMGLGAVFLPYFGHMAGGALAGALAATGSRILARLSTTSVHPSSWNDFVITYAPSHWVVVSLHSGHVYAGKLSNADTSVAALDRDLVLEEPALYDEGSGQYIAMPYQHMFLPAAAVYSIAAVYEPKSDRRVTQVGEPIFKDEEHEREDAATSTSSASPAAGVGGTGQQQAVDANTSSRHPAASPATAADKVEKHDP